MGELWTAGPGAYVGLNYNGMHDSSVCLSDRHGHPVYAMSEERFSRVKMEGRFPRRALSAIDFDDVAGIGIPYLSHAPERVESAPVFRDLLHTVPNYPVDEFPRIWRERLDSLGKPLHFFDHHDMHAYTGFVLSGYAEALVLTSDYGAYSCPVTAGAYHVRRGKVTRLAGASMSEHVALAGLYTDVTALLGFSPCKHEGKITGLAAHGRPSRECREHVWELHRRIRSAEHNFYGWVGFFDEDIPPFYEPNRHLVQRYRAELPFSDADIARAAQDLLEEKLLAVAQWLEQTQGTDLPLILSGGVFANVRANLELARVGFSKVFVAPPMGDDGLSIGAAAAAAHQEDAASGAPPAAAFPLSMALGTTPGEGTEVRLKELGIVFSRPDDPAGALATHLARGESVAVVRGRQEFGPRALGRRSILSSAADPVVNERLNASLQRTEFMPFAPILRAERVDEVFDLSGIPSDVGDCLPFMTMCLPVHPRIRDTAPAVVHVDGTARPQAVSESADPFLHRLLASYEERTGIPLLINTSFNIHDEPLVSDLDDALAAFFTAQLDVLYLDGGFVVALRDNAPPARMAKLLRRGGDGVAKKRHRALNLSFGRQMVDGAGRFTEWPDGDPDLPAP